MSNLDDLIKSHLGSEEVIWLSNDTCDWDSLTSVCPSHVIAWDLANGTPAQIYSDIIGARCHADVMVRKMDSCMVDLLNYHNQDLSDDDEFASACGDSIDESQPQSPSKPANQKSSYTGFLDMMRSLSAPLRHSFELLDRRLSTERSRAPNLQDTAQDSLGHSPNQIGPEVQTSPPTQSQLDASLRASQSSLYKPSSESCSPRNEDGVQQKSSQADVFESWQKENRVPHSPFMTASNWVETIERVWTNPLPFCFWYSSFCLIVAKSWV